MCEHVWQHIYEEFLLGGSFPIGFRCKICKTFVSQNEIGPRGLGGTDSGERVLHGPHGCKSVTSTGKTYSEQIIHADGKLEVIP
jgi:hypothetical protein